MRFLPNIVLKISAPKVRKKYIQNLLTFLNRIHVLILISYVLIPFYLLCKFDVNKRVSLILSANQSLFKTLHHLYHQVPGAIKSQYALPPPLLPLCHERPPPMIGPVDEVRKPGPLTPQEEQEEVCSHLLLIYCHTTGPCGVIGSGVMGLGPVS